MKSNTVLGYRAFSLATIASALVLTACGPGDDDLSAQNTSTTTTTTTTVVTRTPVPAETLAAQQAAVQPPAAKPVPAAPVARVAPPAPETQRVQYRDDRVASSARIGQVTHIETLTAEGPNSRAGAVIGGVLGAVVGNQIGDGSGRTAATVLGGVGGAAVGNRIEKSRNRQIVGYKVQVTLDNGAVRTFERQELNGLSVGDRVRVDSGSLRRV